MRRRAETIPQIELKIIISPMSASAQNRSTLLFSHQSHFGFAVAVRLTCKRSGYFLDLRQSHTIVVSNSVWGHDG